MIKFWGFIFCFMKKTHCMVCMFIYQGIKIYKKFNHGAYSVKWKKRNRNNLLHLRSTRLVKEHIFAGLFSLNILFFGKTMPIKLDQSFNVLYKPSQDYMHWMPIILFLLLNKLSKLANMKLQRKWVILQFCTKFENLFKKNYFNI